MIRDRKGIAWAAMRSIEQADRERELYYAVIQTVALSPKDFLNLILDAFEVAMVILDDEIEYRRRDYDLVFQTLRKVRDYDDSLRYTEPSSWMVLTQHAYAALILEQGHIEEAARAYAEDLGRFGYQSPTASV